MGTRSKSLLLFRGVLTGLVIGMGAGVPARAAALGTEFTFQGQLKQDGLPAPTGSYQMVFDLFNGSDPQVATSLGTVGPMGVTVTDGLFSVPLDFGGTAFDGCALWIRVTVDATPLSPLQPVNATPYALFALDGAGAGATPWQLAGSDMFYLAGNVGIGTDTPTGALEVAGPIRSSGASGGSFIAYNPNNLSASVQLSWLDDVARIRYGGSGAGAGGGFDIQGTSNTSKLRILDNGNVGIGTSNPSSNNALTIQGYESQTSSNWLQLRNAAGVDEWHMNNLSGGLNFVESGVGDYRLFLEQGGRIGIGTNAPGQRLHVAGNVRMDGDLLGYSSAGDETVDIDAFSGTYAAPTISLRDHNESGVLTSMFFLTANDNTANGGARAFMRNSLGDTTLDLRADVNDAGRITIRQNTTDKITLTADDGTGASRIITDVLQINGADLSEQFDISGAEAIEPGTVVSIDPANPGKLAVATEAYDRKVAGIVSGAGGVRTGLVMGQEGTIAHGEYAAALTGRVWCHVDAGFGAVAPGDQLTTSTTPGYAMKASDHDRAHGAVLGKAMTALESGTGMVLVLVQLQ